MNAIPVRTSVMCQVIDPRGTVETFFQHQTAMKFATNKPKTLKKSDFTYFGPLLPDHLAEALDLL